ncbi:FadR/GntR family transcriptional regulator [Nocardia harenae]|uniref:FadR/GntR family transcriptional regulator n=1 Tax=Nocardia harenae TaxID=358707 RepID=UPI000830F6E5|nr:FCD domain-containing protein [Nocardia harenae]
MGKLASQVARRIEGEIIGRGWPVGAVLGSEQDLRVRYGVSRSVLREAVRLAEHHQVARMRRGPNGGLLVRAPDAIPATRALVIFLEYIGTTVEDLMFARLLLEPLAAGLAAARIDEDGVLRLRECLAEEQQRAAEPGIFAQDVLHVLVGESSGNPVLGLFVDVLARLTARYAHATRLVSRDEVTRGKAHAHTTHLEIVEAVISGDGGRAQAASADHLRRVSAWLLERRTRRVRTGVATRQPSEPGAKLAEVVAGRIHDEITRRGWPVGQVLGSEADLLARHGVSRAVLREAVRLLEYHSVARMRRGPGGGLVVTAPDPRASMETIALYLSYRRVSAEDLVVVRETVEVGALGRVLARRDDPAVVAGLGQAAAGDGFHAGLAKLSENPVLEIFLGILTELWARHRGAEGGQGAACTGNGGNGDGGRVHQRIVEAVLVGDEGLAQHRLRRHIQHLTA